MHTQQSFDPQMKIRNAVGVFIPPVGHISVNEFPAVPESPEARVASRMVAACRANVDFLNRHLSPFAIWLSLPHVTENTLYLAYTITVRDDAPFSALELRLKLEKRGIETRSHFSFTDNALLAVTRGRNHSNGKVMSLSDTFCIGCHHALTIPDLQHIVSSIAGVMKELLAAAN